MLLHAFPPHTHHNTHPPTHLQPRRGGELQRPERGGHLHGGQAVQQRAPLGAHLVNGGQEAGARRRQLLHLLGAELNRGLEG
jgi:hypothetical protein